MQLTDLVSIESWTQLAEDVHKRFGFNSCIYNTENSIIHVCVLQPGVVSVYGFLESQVDPLRFEQIEIIEKVEDEEDEEDSA